jgi:hypothetical protein
MRKFFTLRSALLLCILGLAMNGFSQSNPVAQSLPYSQNFNSFTGSTTVYPAGFQGWTIGGSLSLSFSTAAPASDLALTAATNAATSGFVGDMNGKMGILSTASNVKAIAFAINTTNFSNVTVAFTAATQRQLAGERIDELGVQYRIGSTGVFTNIGASTYQNNAITANISGTGFINPANISFTLPVACNNQPVVQIRWVIRDVSGANNRPGFSIDDLSISGTGAIPATSLLSPSNIAAGSAGFNLTVNGSGFSNQSTVTWGGFNRTTTFVNANQLTAVIPASDITTPGTVSVGVTTTGVPTPSNTQTFTIDAAATPTLLVTSPPAAYGSVCLNAAPVTNSFTVNAANLNGTDLVLSALPGFTYSETGVSYTNTLNISYTGGGFTGKQIYVKFAPAAVQSYDGNILIGGGGIAGVSVPVTASGINTAATVITGGNIVAGNSASLSGSILVMGCGSLTSYGFEYSINRNFVNGTGIQVTAVNLNSGSFSRTVSGLTGATKYYYTAFATNGVGTAYGAKDSFTTSSVIPVVMSAQPLLRYTENFNDINNWSANFTSGIGANHFSSVPVGGSAAIPNATRTTTSTATFATASSGGVQKGTGTIVLLSTGASPENSTAVAVDFYMDFSGVNAGTLSFDWASVNNSTGDRKGSLRVYGSTDGVNFTEITTADVLNFTNNVPSTGTVNSVALPASFSNSATARLRFYYHNGTGGTVGSRPKISIDNLIVTGVASSPCVTPSAAPTSLTFGTITETNIQGNFVAAIPAANEYLVIMSTNSTLTSNPLDGQSYVVGDNVGDGTVIAKGNELNFTATDLTGATTYYFFVFSVNSVCTGGPKYQIADVLTDDATTVAGLPNCAAPLSQATDLTLNVATNSIQGTFTTTTADEYLVLQSSSSSLSNLPVNGVVYNAGTVSGNATVIQRSSAATFTASGLTPATQYYYYIFSVNSQACLNGPVYNTVTPLSGTASTQPLPVCITPAAQPANLSFNASNNSVTATFNTAGSGYNYLVVMSSSPALNATPADNIDYAAGNSLGGGTVISNATSTSFIATGLANSTTYYFFVFSANKNCTGGTKYLAASPLTGNATTTNAPVNNYYFGNLHAHSDYSDGQKDNPGGTPADAYTYALGSMGMDFLGISEHNHFSSLNNPGNELANYHLGVAQAATFNSTHSNFLALYGMEWGVISGGGHVLVYGDGMNDLFGWESNVNGNVGANYDVYVPKNTYLGVEGLFKKVNDYVAKNTFASLAHPNSADFNNLSNIPYDQSADDAISGVAVESGPATSANTTYSNPSTMNSLWYFNKLLSKGYHLGPMIDHDNHNTTFGRHTAARTAVIAPALTQTDIIKGVREMHFYATEDMDAKVDFTINTRIMGSVFEDRNAPSIAVNLTDATNSTSGALIRVMFGKPGSNILPVVADSVFASSLSYVDNNLANHETGYYYIDITYGGKRIVTSPIWYTRTCASSGEITVSACDSYNWAGTLYTTSTVATKVFTTVGGCDSTVTLHLTINSSPSAATIAVVGSDTGCPGTGVALTATAGGTIASYQWLQNGNLVATTTAGNYAALASGGYSVKAVNLDNCSVVSANTISVTVEDNIAPVPVIDVLPVIAGQCSATVVSAPTATDNCAGTITATTTDALTYATQGTYTIHWIYNDGNGNTSTQDQAVIVQDNVAPAADLSSLSAITGECTATVSVAPTATDNCAGVLTATTSDPLTYAAEGTYTIHWIFNDGHGNTSTQEQTVIIHDASAPVITTPGNISVNNDAGKCGATVAINTATVTDNCGIASTTGIRSDGALLSAVYPVGTTTITWTSTDIPGNQSTASQTVTVTDVEKPTITAPGTYYVVNTPGQCGATIAGIGTPVTADNCGITSVTNNHPSTFYPVGTTIVTWTVTDTHGNVTDTAKQTIKVMDNELPTISVTNVSVNNTPGSCSASVVLAAPDTNDNCGVAGVTNNHPSTIFPVGTTNVVWTVTDNNGWTNTATQTVTVSDIQAPVVTPVPDQTFCTGISSYSIPVLTATDNCSSVIVSYAITGATTRSGTGNNASGSFNNGVSTITWTVKDASGNTSIRSTTVTVNALPAVTIAVSNADAFCNKVTLTASSAAAGATYKWTSGSSIFATTQQISLGQANGDGIYQVSVTVGGCTGAAASYNFQKQNLVSSYTILAFDKVDLGNNNIVASGSVGVTSNSGEAEFGSNSSVSSPGSFVKAKHIDKNGSNIVISNPVYGAATGIVLPTMFLNTASTNNLPNKDVAQNNVSTVNGNYKNLTLKKGSRTTVTGNTFGTIRVEQGAQVTFTAGMINIENLQVVKGPRYGYSYIRFAGDAKVLVSTSVSIGSQVYINPDNNNVTFYMGDKKSDEERFTVNGGDTKVTANIYVPNGKLKVTGGYSYGNYGNGYGDCDRDDDEDRYYGQGSAYVSMTGLFVAEKIEGNGKNVIWNSFDCSSAPVPVLNTITRVNNAAKEATAAVTTEEELKVTVMPNPSTSYFTLKLESRYETPVNLRVMDSRGRVVDTRSKLGSNNTIQIGHHYAGGVYYAEMIQGGVKRTVQLIKQK